MTSLWTVRVTSLYTQWHTSIRTHYTQIECTTMLLWRMYNKNLYSNLSFGLSGLKGLWWPQGHTDKYRCPLKSVSLIKWNKTKHTCNVVYPTDQKYSMCYKWPVAYPTQTKFYKENNKQKQQTAATLRAYCSRDLWIRHVCPETFVVGQDILITLMEMDGY